MRVLKSVPGHVRVESCVLIHNDEIARVCFAPYCTNLMFIVIFQNIPFLLLRLTLLRPCSPTVTHGDSLCIYPTSIVALTQTYIRHNLAYIRHVLHPEVLTEMQNVITSLIVAARPA